MQQSRKIKDYWKYKTITRAIDKGIKIALIGSVIAATDFTPKYVIANDNKGTSKEKVFAVNAVLQGLIGGIGAKKNGKSFWEGFSKGALGGIIIASGKYLVGQDKNMAWPAKFITSLGSSITYNTANNKGILDSYGFDFGPAYFSWEKKEKGYDFKAYLLAESAVIITQQLIVNKLDFKKTLKYGTPIFIADNLDDSKGKSLFNVVIMEKDYTSQILSHELVHTHQYASHYTLTSIFPKRYHSMKKQCEKLNLSIDKLVGHASVLVPQLPIPHEKRPFEIEAYTMVNYP